MSEMMRSGIPVAVGVLVLAFLLLPTPPAWGTVTWPSFDAVHVSGSSSGTFLALIQGPDYDPIPRADLAFGIAGVAHPTPDDLYQHGALGAYLLYRANRINSSNNHSFAYLYLKHITEFEDLDGNSEIDAFDRILQENLLSSVAVSPPVIRGFSASLEEYELPLNKSHFVSSWGSSLSDLDLLGVSLAISITDEANINITMEVRVFFEEAEYSGFNVSRYQAIGYLSVRNYPFKSESSKLALSIISSYRDQDSWEARSGYVGGLTSAITLMPSQGVSKTELESPNPTWRSRFFLIYSQSPEIVQPFTMSLKPGEETASTADLTVPFLLVGVGGALAGGVATVWVYRRRKADTLGGR